MFLPSGYLDKTQTEHWSLFEGVDYVWEPLAHIGAYLKKHLKPGIVAKDVKAAHIGENVYVGSGTCIEPGVVIKGPAWIGDNCEIRSGAYIRENVIVGAGSVLGNSCEFKNSILFNRCQVPHFSYVGDSILGAKVHLAAGVICSNVKLHSTVVEIEYEGKKYATGLRKFGAILGDEAEVGCNAVLNPGSVIGRHSLIYPGTQWRGVLPANSVVKATVSYQIVPRRG
jgi:UDP-N-acetylglucosamine diphosphorylase / glucose-1-phosphate thymidylyltransferase / UDP-N-acetylgalactosamine diphosphorylase / glucosamine-1-phosphate N-acetyltransferase / galactosamine-1-phosphate N-acetyltransferase